MEIYSYQLNLGLWFQYPVVPAIFNKINKAPSLSQGNSNHSDHRLLKQLGLLKRCVDCRLTSDEPLLRRRDEGDKQKSQ